MRSDIDDTIEHLKLALFDVSTPALTDSWDRYARLQYAKYGDQGLRCVPGAQMPAAVDEVFRRMQLKTGQRLLEIGPGPHGGVGLIAALMGLHVVMVEYGQPFLLDVDLLRTQLASVDGSGAALSQISQLSGPIHVSQIDNLRTVLRPHRKRVAAASGSIEIVPGDFADANVLHNVKRLGPIDHIVCTDVISPMQGSFSTTTAAFTTGDAGKIHAMVNGLAEVAIHAESLYIGFIVPEQSDEFKGEMMRTYESLERKLQDHGKSVHCDRVISPSSGTVVRSRLYHLAQAPNEIAVHSQVITP
jgi:hypothetical protein